jgi:hypothetical protein
MAVMVGVHSHKKLPCLLGPVRYVEHGTSSTVGPEKHGIVAHRVKNVQRVTTICYDELSSYIERQIKYNPNLARRNHGTAARFLVIGFLIMVTIRLQQNRPPIAAVRCNGCNHIINNESVLNKASPQR